MSKGNARVSGAHGNKKREAVHLVPPIGRGLWSRPIVML
jgi:hypothetical protein